MPKPKKVRTIIELWKVSPKKEKKEFFRSIRIEANPVKVWRAIEDGVYSELGIDLEELRAVRKRKGGRK